MFEFKAYEWMTLLAIIVGPILAVQAQNFLNKAGASRERKNSLFRILMATRARPLISQHVEALNMIRLEFYGNASKDSEVVAQWRKYLDHLNSCPQDNESADFQHRFAVWSDKTDDYLTDLLFAMAKALGYSIDRVEIKKGVYLPKGHLDIDTEENFIRRSMVDMWLGQKHLPVEIVRVVSNNGGEASKK